MNPICFLEKSDKAQQDSIDTLVKVGYIKKDYNFEEHINTNTLMRLLNNFKI